LLFREYRGVWKIVFLYGIRFEFIRNLEMDYTIAVRPEGIPEEEREKIFAAGYDKILDFATGMVYSRPVVIDSKTEVMKKTGKRQKNSRR